MFKSLQMKLVLAVAAAVVATPAFAWGNISPF